MDFEEFWKHIGRVDNIFGILGGITMIWGMIAQMRRKGGKNESKPTKTNTNNKIPAGIIENSIEHAKEPISCAMIVATVFLFLIVIIALLREESPLFYGFTFLSNLLSSIFFGLIIGTLINFLFGASGTPVKWVFLSNETAPGRA
jgi:hypothetical protein